MQGGLDNRVWKVLPAVLVTLALAVLAACGGQSPSAPAATTPPNTPAAEPTTPAATSAPAEALAAGARTFRIVAEESEASYTVDEEFFSGAVSRLGKALGFFTAVGRTSEIEGQFTVEVRDGSPERVSGEIAVDISTLTSDDSRRDRAIREKFLQSAQHPQATFVITGFEGFPENYQVGEEVSFELVGDMTIREVTQPLSFDVTATFDGDTLSGVATTEILMTDFGFDPPGFAGMMQTENEALVTVNFTAREA